MKKLIVLLSALFTATFAIAQTDLAVLTEKANQGDAEAQFNLGNYYENGIGVAKSEAEAARWYRKAASQGNKDAKDRLDDFNRKSSIEYYMLGGGLVSLMSGPSCFILTAYANGTTASLPITITGVGDNGACVYSVYGTNMMYAASDSEHSYLLVGSPNPEKYERCTPAEATEILQQEAQIFGSTNPTPNNVSGYGTNSGTNSGTTGYESVGSASATVISSGYGSDSSYMGHSTNGANYSAMVNSSFYFVRIN